MSKPGDPVIPSDWDILRRYLSGPNLDTYCVDRRTLAPIPYSYRRSVSHDEALAALARLKAAHGD